MDNSRRILADHKVSITNPRIVVLEALLETKSPITVDELLSQLRNKVAKSTLYRVLNDLKDINILHEFSTPDNQTVVELIFCLLYTSPSPRDLVISRMPSSA